MSREILTLGQSMVKAVKIFGVGAEEKPQFIRLGIPPIDNVLGGLFPGTVGILGAATGVGKSSIMLASALASPDKVGIISTEDTPDVVGLRILAARTGIDSLRMRRGDLSPADIKRIIDVSKKDNEGVMVAYEVGSSLEEIVESTQDLIDAGCKLIWLDYVQKVRGVSDDRKSEVMRVYGGFQRTCSRGGAAGMVVSQFRRLADITKPPQIYHLKESGDLENEARLIILGHRDPKDPSILRFRLAKSTVGGENTVFLYKRDSSGTLQLVEHKRPGK